METIIEEKLKLIGKNPNDDSIYQEIVFKTPREERMVDKLLEQSEHRLSMLNSTIRPKPNYSPTSKIVRAAAIMAAINPTPIYSCDQMLYLKSNGRVCYNSQCYDLSTYSLMLSDGQTACFNDLNNERLSIQFNRIDHMARYSKLYVTAEYKITNAMTWNVLVMEHVGMVNNVAMGTNSMF